MNDIFTRAFWDERVRTNDTRRLLRQLPDGGRAAARRRVHPEGFRAAQRGLADLGHRVGPRRGGRACARGSRASIRDDTPVAPMRADLGPPEAEAAEIKGVARLFGADLVGITHLRRRAGIIPTVRIRGR